MIRKNYQAFFSLLLLLQTAGCNPFQPTFVPIAYPPPSTETTYPVFVIELIQDENTQRTPLGSKFSVDLSDNCGSPVSTIETFKRSRQYQIQVEMELSSKIVGEVGGGVPGIAEAKLGGEVAQALGISIGTTEIYEFERMIETPARSTSSATFQWSEIWSTGRIIVKRSDNSVIGEVPFRALLNLHLAQLDVDILPCSDQSTETATQAMPTGTTSMPTLTPNINLFPTNIPTKQINPMVSRIAFVRYMHQFENPSIWVINSDGSDEHKLAGFSSNARDPSWSPDGTMVAFASDKDGDYEIYIMNVENAGRNNDNNWLQLTYNTVDDRGPAWSPNGEWIAYHSPHGDYAISNIYLIRPDLSEEIRLTNNSAQNRSPSWSPDSKQIAFMYGTLGNTQIAIMDWDSKGGTIVDILTPKTQNSIWPSWTHDGRNVTYTRFKTGSQIGSICRYDLQTKEEKKIVTDNSASQDWSVDGTQIAFSCWRSKIPKIWILDVTTEVPRQLTNGLNYDSQPVWYP